MADYKARDQEYLLDILNSAKIAISYVENKTYSDFMTDLQCQDAVIRRLEIVGEATRRISEKTKSDLRGLPWVEMTGMRNFLIHEYGEVDMTTIWDTLTTDLPLLVNELAKLIGQL